MLSREQLEDIKECTGCCKCRAIEICSGEEELSELTAQTALILMDQVEAQQKEIEQLEKFKQDSLGLIQRHEKLKERHATMMEKAQEFIELYEAGPCDFVGEVPSLMDLHHRYYCIFKDIGGGQ